MTTELAKTLTTALVQFIDRERPEGTMCCSNAECESIEQMFEGGCYDIVEKFIKKKLSSLTEFEQEVSDIVEYCKEHGKNVAFDYAKRHANTLLSLARKELLSYPDESNPAIEAMADLERTFECNPEKLPLWLKEALADKYQKGYYKGRIEALEEYNKSVAFRYYDARPLCWEPGGTCTNPQMDCINCPRKTTGGGFNTAFGTSTATLHGNTSATDGKPHDPSFTD